MSAICHSRVAGTLLTSSLPIAVIGTTRSQSSNDAFAIPSVDQLGTSYMVITSILYNSVVTDVGPFVFAIMATADNTLVTVQCNTPGASLTLTYAGQTCTKGGTMTLLLNNTQAIQVRVSFPVSGV